MSTGTKPLTGIRILDLTDEPLVLAGRLLAELGADVIRVEDARGDAVRRRAPFLGGQPGNERSFAHLQFNAGKRSLALDLEAEATWKIVCEVAAGCDAVLAPLAKSEAMASALQRIAATDGPVRASSMQFSAGTTVAP